MSASAPFDEYPTEVRRLSGGVSRTYRMLPGCYAIRGAHEGINPAAILWAVPGEAVTVCRGLPPEASDCTDPPVITPVYSLQTGGPPMAPTGEVFVRLDESVRIEQRIEDLKRAGYVVSRMAPYAPHAAWIRASSGTVLDALTGIARLEQMKDVAAIEPQMLGPVARK